MKRVGFLTLFIFIYSTRSNAEPHEIIFCATGFSGTTEQARPVLEKLFSILERRLNWKDIKGEYYPEPNSCWKEIENRKVGFALLTHGLYLFKRKTTKMKVIGQVFFIDEANSQFFVIVNKNSQIENISQLEGKKIVTNYYGEEQFLREVIFEGKIKEVQFEAVSSPLKGLRGVAQGKIEASLVDKSVINNLQSLPFKGDLKIIYKSILLPGAPIVAFNNRVNQKDIKLLQKTLISLCESEGKETCNTMRVAQIKEASEATYIPLTKFIK